MSIGLRLPPSKSQTMRALTFALLAKGKTLIKNPLFSPDTTCMCQALEHFGCSVKISNDQILVRSLGEIKKVEDVINCGNSGIILRFMGAISALSPYPVVLTGDYSVRHLRVIEPLLRGLEDFGAEAFSLRGEGAPVFIRGPLKKGRAIIAGEDSQPISALLIACSFSKKGPFELVVRNAGEKSWVDLTLSWLNRFQIRYERHGYEKFYLFGNSEIKGFEYEVPTDLSSSLFPIVAALITQKEITIETSIDPDQGDKKCIDMLIAKGANIVYDKGIKVQKTDKLFLGEIDVNPFIDALPILSVLACFCRDKTRLRGAKIARNKECDRIKVMVSELTKMGAKIEEEEDGLVIYPSELNGARVNSFNDHRVAMALAIAGLKTKSEVVFDNKECVEKSYPHFFQDLEQFI